MPLIKIDKIGGEGGRGDLKEIISCLAVNMLNLRYLWDIQVEMFNRELKNKIRSVENLDI